MENTIGWGKIYEKTRFENKITENAINWGKTHEELVSTVNNHE